MKNSELKAEISNIKRDFLLFEEAKKQIDARFSNMWERMIKIEKEMEEK